MPLNYYAINKVLGGTMVPTQRHSFGGFGTLRVVGEMLRNRPRKPKHVPFDYQMDALVAKAFEDVRDGRAPERVLWDTKLASRFHVEARRLGVHAPSSQLDRRLINIRKNKARYLKHGISLSETTVIDTQPSIVPEYAHVLEFALVRLRNRYGASIDDILLEPELAQEYEKLTRTVANRLTSTEIRLGALYIRKTRHVAKNELPLFDEMNADEIEEKFEDLGTLSRITANDVPAEEGLLEVLENKNYLYISRNDNLRSVVKELVEGQSLALVSNHFWTPRRDSIDVRIYRGARFDELGLQRWQLKLIRERNPVFNWPVIAA